MILSLGYLKIFNALNLDFLEFHGFFLYYLDVICAASSFSFISELLFERRRLCASHHFDDS